MGPAARLLIGFVTLYRLSLSLWLGGRCGFYPSCSEYGLQALRHHGAWRGTWLTVTRILRCHPWSPGGIDPVPPQACSPKGQNNE